MFESIIHNAYWTMFMQVVVTLLLCPLFSVKQFNDSANVYCQRFYPEAKDELQTLKLRYFKVLFISVLVFFCGSLAIVWYAKTNSMELFNWDNQAGLIVLFAMAILPVIMIGLMQKRLFLVFKKHAGGQRIASLKQQKWQSYISIPLLVLIGIGQFLFILTVHYFVNHPFSGFAGYINLFGLVLIDLIFIVSCLATYRSNKLAIINDLEQRANIKMKAIKVAMMLWIIAIYHVTISLWVSGLEIEGLRLISQSLYLQLALFLAAYCVLLPKPLIPSDITPRDK